MSAETKKVLEMLAAGKISQEDAERLLDKLTGAQAPQGDAANSQRVPPSSGSAGGSTANAPRARFVHIQVDRPGRDAIDMRVPLSSMRGGRHWMAFLPIRLADKLDEYGFDFGCLETMNDDDFRKAMDQMNVDIQGRSGRRVRIYAE
jgi:hypothetical protein